MENLYNALFTGQGAQYVGMLDEFVGEEADILNIASELLGYDLRDVSRDAAKIYETRYSQPLNYVYEYLKYRQLTERSSWKADIMLGHSMGEFVALTCAGVLNFQDGLRLISKRAEIMSKAAAGFRMVSVIGIEIYDVEKLCEAYGNTYKKSALISNCNGMLQTIITIEENEFENFEALAKEKFENVIIKALMLPYPFHTRHMKPLADEFREYIEKANFSQLQNKLILNANGRIFKSDDLNILKKYLIEQMYMPVRFTECMKQGFLTGVSQWVEFGPKAVLAKMIKREYNELQVFHVDDILSGFVSNLEIENATKEENVRIDILGKYLYILSSKETKSGNADFSAISSKYRLLKKLYLTFEKEETCNVLDYQTSYARSLFEDAMNRKGYSAEEIVKLI